MQIQNIACETKGHVRTVSVTVGVRSTEFYNTQANIYQLQLHIRNHLFMYHIRPND